MNKIDLIIAALEYTKDCGKLWEISVIDEALAAARELREFKPVQSKYSDIVSDGGLDPRNKFDAQHVPQVCCGDYEKCIEPCTPKGEWLAKKELAKPWVGLTINEVWDAYEEGNYDDVRFARAIEQLLKDKNERS